jgi:putative thioredoxin
MATQIPSQRSAGAAVIDVSERTFEQDVLARSREVPVVVDFWAPWCGPCRVLGPVLERLATEAHGAFVLAKVNVDENQRLAAMFQVQGIPAVKAFRHGQPVDEFTGALPESQVRAWLKRIVPSEADAIIAAAGALEATNPQEAEARYRVALGADPTNQTGLFGLGRLLLLRGEVEGRMLLNEVAAGTPYYTRAQGLLSLGDLLGAEPGDPARLAAQVERDPSDLEGRFQLAAALVRHQHYAEAMDHLLAIVERDRTFRDDGARKALLGIFALLGDDDPLTGQYRRALTSVLF